MKRLIVIAFMALPVFVQAHSFKYQKTEGDYQFYKGQTTLTGIYTQDLNPDNVEYLDNTVCFYPDIKSTALIPRPKGDERVMPWFCFSNVEAAKKIFKLPSRLKSGDCSYEGRALINIKDYQLFIVASDGYDLTHLVSAINITPTKAIKCDAEYQENI